MSIIRSMTAEDAAKVASLEAEIFRSRGVRMLLDSLCLPDNDLLVAEESGVIQGYIGMYLAADEGEDHKCGCESCVPQAWNRGKGCSQR